ncbi:MAG: hypothetical protein H0W70_01710 [Actinobacteria bacterium]|nr:hypothetical protein [Actinomycetota bacterium]
MRWTAGHSRTARRWGFVGVLIIVLSGAVLGPSSGASTSAAAVVKMIHFTFDPATTTIAAGTTVTWTYAESATDPMPGCESPQFQLVSAAKCPGHSTTSVTAGPDGQPLWDSGVHRADGFPFSHTFTTPGTYAYFCTIHGGSSPNNPLTAMNGTIVVTAANDNATAATATNSSSSRTGVADRPGSLALTGDAGWLGLGGIALAIALLARRATRVWA